MRVNVLTHRSIRPYGCIIDSKRVVYRSGDNGFGIIFRERSVGWRIAYLVVRKKKIVRLECHPNTAETFEPVKGKVIIALATHGNPQKFKLFLLDKPIVLKRGVWHNVASLTGRCEIKICEGIKVLEVYYKLNRPIEA